MNEPLMLVQPISLACRVAGEDFDPTLPHIVVQCHSQRCLSCAKTARWSETYECITKGKTRQFLPCRSPGSIPIDYAIQAVTMPCSYVPICFECVSVRSEPDIEAHRRWQETLMRKRSAAAEEAKATAAPSKPTLDML